MKGTPHLATFAEDGRAAVNKFTAYKFDLVLMDLQMPVMDGVAATRAIRAVELERGTASIPIIAPTANARPEDVEMSRDAGCNSYLSKPISKPTLLGAVEEHRLPIPQVTTTESVQPIRIEIPSGLEEIAPGYLAARKEEVSRMLRSLGSSDFENIAGVSHNLKGTGLPYGLPELTRLGEALEQSARETDAGAVGTKLTELQTYPSQVQFFQKVEEPG